MTEIFKDIDGYEGLYQVSNLGRVKSLNYKRTRKEKILKPQKCDKFGYLFVILCKDGEIKHKVHRLVGKAFVDGWFEGAVINHKDHHPENNCAENLEWTTQADNCSSEKSFCAEISKKLFTNGILSKKVYQYTKSGEFVKEWQSLMEIKRQLNFSPSHICDCCNGKRKSAYKFIWRYA